MRGHLSTKKIRINFDLSATKSNVDWSYTDFVCFKYCPILLLLHLNVEKSVNISAHDRINADQLFISSSNTQINVNNWWHISDKHSRMDFKPLNVHFLFAWIWFSFYRWVQFSSLSDIFLAHFGHFVRVCVKWIRMTDTALLWCCCWPSMWAA